MTQTLIGELMRRWRREHGLTQTRAAAQCGISEGVWKDLEQGERDSVNERTADILDKVGIHIPIESIHMRREYTPRKNAFDERRLEAPVPDEVREYIATVLNWRRENGMCFSRFCDLAGLNRSVISKCERGIKHYTKNAMRKIESVTGIPPISDEDPYAFGDEYRIVCITPGCEEILLETGSRRAARAEYTRQYTNGALVRVSVKQSDGSRRILPIYEADRQFKAGEFYHAKSIVVRGRNHVV